MGPASRGRNLGKIGTSKLIWAWLYPEVAWVGLLSEAIFPLDIAVFLHKYSIKSSRHDSMRFYETRKKRKLQDTIDNMHVIHVKWKIPEISFSAERAWCLIFRGVQVYRDSLKREKAISTSTLGICLLTCYNKEGNRKDEKSYIYFNDWTEYLKFVCRKIYTYQWPAKNTRIDAYLKIQRHMVFSKQ